MSLVYGCSWRFVFTSLLRRSVRGRMPKAWIAVEPADGEVRPDERTSAMVLRGVVGRIIGRPLQNQMAGLRIDPELLGRR